jgi:hypothetical protein
MTDYRDHIYAALGVPPETEEEGLARRQRRDGPALELRGVLRAIFIWGGLVLSAHRTIWASLIWIKQGGAASVIVWDLRL